MPRVITAVTLAVLGLFAVGPAAATAASPTPQPSITTELANVPCSVTTYGLAFTRTGPTSMSYGAGISCAGGVGSKRVNVVPEVRKLVSGRAHWYIIGGIGLYQGPTPANPLRVTGSAAYVPGHVYRLLVYGDVSLPDGRIASKTVCAGCAPSTTPPPRLSIAGYNRNEPFPPRTVTLPRIPGLTCSVTEFGSVFKIVNLTYVNDYGATATCSGAAAATQRTLTVCAQVSNRANGRTAWYTITGSCLSDRATAVTAPMFLTTGRAVYIGHGYRVMAEAAVTYRTASGTSMRSATAYGSEAAP
ncbi:MAG: hypothetical protein WBQ18_02150 [Solirubrobacteraceae bacterium]